MVNGKGTPRGAGTKQSNMCTHMDMYMCLCMCMDMCMCICVCMYM